MALKKIVLLDLNAKVKVIEADRETICRQIKIGKTQVYDILKSKWGTKRKWSSGNGSMKSKLKKTGKEDINEIVWHCFVCAGAKNIAYLDQYCNRKQNQWLID
jgi:hypothetical protein